MTKKRVHVFVSGRVQGVFFRQTTRETAMNLGVSGWVRNLSDGRVEAVFEGNADLVEKITDWCRKGPQAARVTDIEIIEEEYQGEFDKFTIK